MNKPVAKPKRKAPLFPDEDVTDAQIERHLRINHAQISQALRQAKAEMDAGKGTPLESLEDLLAGVRSAQKSA